MEYNIYCDESCHLEHDGIPVMAIGGVWCEISKKNEMFTRLRQLKVEHGLKPTNELKWNGVSHTKLSYYKDVMNYFFENSDIHFRVIIVPDKRVLNHKAFHQTHDEFYYKMYFDMLKAIISPSNSYSIYLDIKDTRGGQKTKRLREVLSNNMLDFDRKCIKKIQQVKSHEVELIELADFLIGCVTYANRLEKDKEHNLTSESKKELVSLMRDRSGYHLTKSTLLREDKVNIFVWSERGV